MSAPTGRDKVNLSVDTSFDGFTVGETPSIRPQSPAFVPLRRRQGQHARRAFGPLHVSIATSAAGLDAPAVPGAVSGLAPERVTAMRRALSFRTLDDLVDTFLPTIATIPQNVIIATSPAHRSVSAVLEPIEGFSGFSSALGDGGRLVLDKTKQRFVAVGPRGTGTTVTAMQAAEQLCAAALKLASKPAATGSTPKSPRAPATPRTAAAAAAAPPPSSSGGGGGGDHSSPDSSPLIPVRAVFVNFSDEQQMSGGAALFDDATVAQRVAALAYRAALSTVAAQISAAAGVPFTTFVGSSESLAAAAASSLTSYPSAAAASAPLSQHQRWDSGDGGAGDSRPSSGAAGGRLSVGDEEAEDEAAAALSRLRRSIRLVTPAMFAPGGREAMAALARALGTKRLVLVVDNAGLHLADVFELAAADGSVKVVCTSGPAAFVAFQRHVSAHAGSSSPPTAASLSPAQAASPPLTPAMRSENAAAALLTLSDVQRLRLPRVPDLCDPAILSTRGTSGCDMLLARPFFSIYQLCGTSIKTAATAVACARASDPGRATVLTEEFAGEELDELLAAFDNDILALGLCVARLLAGLPLDDVVTPDDFAHLGVEELLSAEEREAHVLARRAVLEAYIGTRGNGGSGGGGGCVPCVRADGAAPNLNLYMIVHDRFVSMLEHAIATAESAVGNGSFAAPSSSSAAAGAPAASSNSSPASPAPPASDDGTMIPDSASPLIVLTPDVESPATAAASAATAAAASAMAKTITDVATTTEPFSPFMLLEPLLRWCRAVRTAREDEQDDEYRKQFESTTIHAIALTLLAQSERDARRRRAQRNGAAAAAAVVATPTTAAAPAHSAPAAAPQPLTLASVFGPSAVIVSVAKRDNGPVLPAPGDPPGKSLARAEEALASVPRKLDPSNARNAAAEAAKAATRAARLLASLLECESESCSGGGGDGAALDAGGGGRRQARSPGRSRSPSRAAAAAATATAVGLALLSPDFRAQIAEAAQEAANAAQHAARAAAQKYFYRPPVRKLRVTLASEVALHSLPTSFRTDVDKFPASGVELSAGDYFLCGSRINKAIDGAMLLNATIGASKSVRLLVTTQMKLIQRDSNAHEFGRYRERLREVFFADGNDVPPNPTLHLFITPRQFSKKRVDCTSCDNNNGGDEESGEMLALKDALRDLPNNHYVALVSADTMPCPLLAWSFLCTRNITLEEILRERAAALGVERAHRLYAATLPVLSSPSPAAAPEVVVTEPSPLAAPIPAAAGGVSMAAAEPATPTTPANTGGLKAPSTPASAVFSPFGPPSEHDGFKGDRRKAMLKKSWWRNKRRGGQ